MKVLVSAASRHGATREIAQWIAKELCTSGLECDVVEPAQVSDVSEYDAVVIGSAVYVGQWLTEARDLVDRVSGQLGDKKVWLFSSGLADAPSKDSSGTPSLKARIELTGAQGHRHFAGKLDVLELSLAERAAIMAARGKYGDAREPESVRAWAHSIGESLSVGSSL